VGLIQEIENRLLEKLKALFAPVIGPITKLWGILKGMFEAIVLVIPETIDLVKLIGSEVFEWKHFRQGINFKRGVVNLQSVRDHVQDLIDELVQAWRSVVDLFTGGFRRVAGKPFQDAAEAAAELEELFAGLGKIGLSDFLRNIGPKLEKAGGKLFEVLAIVQAIAEELLHVVRDLRSIVDALKDIRTTFETGEGLFLKQTNARKIVKLEDGTTMKIRLGNLH
jgi:hypothetical protein